LLGTVRERKHSPGGPELVRAALVYRFDGALIREILMHLPSRHRRGLRSPD
jgi:hypothetical protein